MFHSTGSAPGCPGKFATSGGEGKPVLLPYTVHTAGKVLNDLTMSRCRRKTVVVLCTCAGLVDAGSIVQDISQRYDSTHDVRDGQRH